MVILITTNSHPYNLHVAPILSLPSGLSYHFRYRRQWVAFDDKPLEQFAGRPGLIVFYLGAGKFIPLRSCTVYRTWDYGDVLFFDVRLGPLVDFTDGRFDAYDQLLTQKVYGGRSFEIVQKLVFRVNDLTPADFRVDEESSHAQSRKIWTQTASRLGQLNELKDVAFFRFALSDGKKEIEPAELDAHTFGYQLTSGRAYTFDVFEYVGGMGPAERIQDSFDYEMQTDTSLLSALKAKERIDGAYDRFDLIFRTAQILISTRTFVILNDQQKVGGAFVPMIYIPLVIKNSLFKRVLALVGTPLSILFFLMPGLAKTLASALYRGFRLEKLLGTPHFALGNEMIQGIAVLVFIGIIANWDFSSFVTTLREKIRF